jgi:hypothetical protein
MNHLVYKLSALIPNTREKQELAKEFEGVLEESLHNVEDLLNPLCHFKYPAKMNDVLNYPEKNAFKNTLWLGYQLARMNHNEAYSICAECNFPLEKRDSGRGYNFVTSPLLLGTFRFHDRTCMRNYLAKTPMFNDGSLSHVLFGSYPNYDLESKRILLMNSGFSEKEAISLLPVSKPIGYIELNVEKCIPLSKTTSSVLMKYQDCDPSHLYIMHLFLNEIDNLSINYKDSEDTFVRTKTATDILTNLKHMVCALKD